MRERLTLTDHATSLLRAKSIRLSPFSLQASVWQMQGSGKGAAGSPCLDVCPPSNDAPLLYAGPRHLGTELNPFLSHFQPGPWSAGSAGAARKMPQS
ncbi:hypothetical protein NDU88_004705 [Pleurodeles waltl]|uniref:Uncharacterized protein n=1 Tax=Pleurodeles waltl TaxID=8319 RepID=A0AAV7PD97_PLEWA|nr:hypothetical protein NDU88_004705 [Pleurodeles waltl]